jgi:hypothetical protein
MEEPSKLAEASLIALMLTVTWAWVAFIIWAAMAFTR